jgi:hypothetical protein
MNNVQIIAQPDVKPSPRAFAGPRPTRPVPVSMARPMVIDEKGKQISAKPGAQPVEPPVKAAPPVKPLPGRTVVAPPPTAKPAALPAVKPAPVPVVKPVVKPVVPPTAKPVAKPAAKPAAQPDRKTDKKDEKKDDEK